jgi:methylmalonyl-CoA/ethylmalonyl-CoA epimerase
VIFGIDHIGLVTDDAAGAGAFMSGLGMHQTDQGIAQAYGVACEFWEYDRGRGGGAPGGPAVETVCPVRDESSVASRLASGGPGLHHIAFTVDDIGSELARLREHGFVPVDSQACAGAKAGMRVAFMYARRPAGLLIELVHYETMTRVPPEA